MICKNKFDRSAIMQDAWARVRRADTAKFGLRLIMSRALRNAWSNAKFQVAMAARAARLAELQTEADKLRAAISMLENKDRWSQADYTQLDRLQADLAQAVAHEHAAPVYAEKRTLIEQAAGRFCAVTFTKADGTERTMHVQPATLRKHIKGDAATAAGKRAALTRKARHPNLLPVWDAKAKAPRSVNLASISRIAVDGQVHEYRA